MQARLKHWHGLSCLKHFGLSCPKHVCTFLLSFAVSAVVPGGGGGGMTSRAQHHIPLPHPTPGPRGEGSGGTGKLGCGEVWKGTTPFCVVCTQRQ